ncbi:MAG: hypothetical protein IH845_01710 [Nanoarchaeota archaeon]|nr:hypothetical protein [Nanoarchaeota archaeon]
MRTTEEQEKLEKDICNNISDSIFKLLKGRREFFAEKLSERQKIKPKTAVTYLSDISNRRLAYKIRPSSSGDTKLHIRRLAVIYDMRNVSRDAPIIDETRYINPDFQYPIR